MASPFIAIHLTGDAALMRALNQVAPKAANSAIGRATTFATTPWLKQVKTNIMGLNMSISAKARYAKSIERRTKSYKSGAIRYVAIWPKNETTTINGRKENWINLGHLIELGTAPHTIGVETKKALVDPLTGTAFGKSVQHPGTAAQPHFRPAFEGKRTEVLKRFREKAMQVLIQKMTVKGKGR